MQHLIQILDNHSWSEPLQWHRLDLWSQRIEIWFPVCSRCQVAQHTGRTYTWQGQCKFCGAWMTSGSYKAVTPCPAFAPTT